MSSPKVSSRCWCNGGAGIVMSSLFLEIETSEDVLESFRAIPAALIISFGHSEILT